MKIESIEKNLSYITSEVICVKCCCRWVAVRPEGTLLKDLECPSCGSQKFVVETGEILIEE